MKKIVRMEGTKVCLNTMVDTIVYDSEKALERRTGRCTSGPLRGIDLYHKLLDEGMKVWYKYHWSTFDGEVNYIKHVDLDEAQKFIEENIDAYTPSEIEWMERLGLIDMNEVR